MEGPTPLVRRTDLPEEGPMRTPSPRRRAAAGLTAAALLLAACSARTTDPDSSTADVSTATTVTMRVWDQSAATAYAESFDALTASHPDVRVKVEVVPRGDYDARAAEDLAAGTMSDVFWADPALTAEDEAADRLVDVGKLLGDEEDGWEPAVTGLFATDGTVWGVPQQWQAPALYYDAALTGPAGVDPARLTWAPGGGEGDALADAARALTSDGAGRHPGDPGFDAGAAATFGINAGPHLLDVVAPFLAANGARLLADGRFAFATPEGAEAVQYLVDLVRTGAAPPVGGAPALDLFRQGRLALLQASSADLPALTERAADLRVAPMIAGPQGRAGVLDAVAAVGNADSKHPGAVETVLEWLGTAEGQAALASRGLGVPAAVAAQDAYVKRWERRGVDVRPVLTAAREPVLALPAGPHAGAATAAVEQALARVFRGELPVAEGLREAQDAGNTALDGK